MDRRWVYLLNISLVVANIVPVLQLDQLVIDSAMEKRDMEHKHATIQQRVSSNSNCFRFSIHSFLGFVLQNRTKHVVLPFGEMGFHPIYLI